jgi:hypothetical protein
LLYWDNNVEDFFLQTLCIERLERAVKSAPPIPNERSLRIIYFNFNVYPLNGKCGKDYLKLLNTTIRNWTLANQHFCFKNICLWSTLFLSIISFLVIYFIDTK